MINIDDYRAYSNIYDHIQQSELTLNGESNDPPESTESNPRLD